MRRRFRQQFRRRILVQVLLLTVTVALLAVSVIRNHYLAVPVLLVLLAGGQVVMLLRTVFRHVDTLEEFFAAVNYEDFTRRFVTDDIDQELKAAFNNVIRKFQEARADRETQATYLETIVKHVPIPFFVVRDDGSLRMVNAPVRRLTGLARLRHIDDLAVLDASLPALIRSVEPGTQRLLQTRLHDISAELRVSAASIRLQGRIERLYAVENLSGELTAREATAWRNLIRVLTHEMMNTLTPVVSLARTCRTMLNDPATVDDLREAIDTIARRAEGLTGFVQRYRELLKMPEPAIVAVPLKPLLQGCVRLMQSELQGIAVTVRAVPEALELQADPQLLDQVLLNLLKNGADALQDQEGAAIELTATLDYGRVVIHVIDNGPGMPDDIADQIFVPFFTTKRDGSGIGLSVCRQIVAAHGGQISLAVDTRGTVATLRF